MSGFLSKRLNDSVSAFAGRLSLDVGAQGGDIHILPFQA